MSVVAYSPLAGRGGVQSCLLDLLSAFLTGCSMLHVETDVVCDQECVILPVATLPMC